MHKSLSKLEVNLNGKQFQFLCDCDSPIGDVKESMFQILKYVGQVEDNAKAQAAMLSQEKVKEEVSETPVEEVPNV